MIILQSLRIHRPGFLRPIHPLDLLHLPTFRSLRLCSFHYPLHLYLPHFLHLDLPFRLVRVAPRRTGKGGCSLPAMSRKVRLLMKPKYHCLYTPWEQHRTQSLRACRGQNGARKKRSEKGRAAMMMIQSSLSGEDFGFATSASDTRGTGVTSGRTSIVQTEVGRSTMKFRLVTRVYAWQITSIPDRRRN